MLYKNEKMLFGNMLPTTMIKVKLIAKTQITLHQIEQKLQHELSVCQGPAEVVLDRVRL